MKRLNLLPAKKNLLNISLRYERITTVSGTFVTKKVLFDQMYYNQSNVSLYAVTFVIEFL